MKIRYALGVSLAVITVLGACSAPPKRIESLENARTVVPQVETSERAGVAAVDLSNARKSLDAANRLAQSGGKRGDIEYQSEMALMSAQIAQQKIAAAEAQQRIQGATADRQKMLIQARENEILKSEQQAKDATERASSSQRSADASEKRVRSLEDELSDMRAQRSERGLVLTLGDVLFDTGQVAIRPAAYGTLDRLASALKDHPTRSVVIEGHTDNVGADSTNLSLSDNRARSVQTALLQRGVSSAQVSAVGRGESAPIGDNDSVEGRQQNRRVELVFADEQIRSSLRPN
jgi:outer membrane protein OmpA-like peptidoglycan-associated protein